MVSPSRVIKYWCLPVFLARKQSASLLSDLLPWLGSLRRPLHNCHCETSSPNIRCEIKYISSSNTDEDCACVCVLCVSVSAAPAEEKLALSLAVTRCCLSDKPPITDVVSKWPSAGFYVVSTPPPCHARSLSILHRPWINISLRWGFSCHGFTERSCRIRCSFTAGSFRCRRPHRMIPYFGAVAYFLGKVGCYLVLLGTYLDHGHP